MSESAAFASWGKWFPRLRYVAWLITHDHHGAEDAAQNAAIDFLRTLRNGGIVHAPRLWLERVTKLRAIDWYRAHERLNAHEAHPTDLMTPSDDCEADVWDAIREPLPSAEDVVIAEIAALQLLRVLDEVAHHDRRSRSQGLIEQVSDGYTAVQIATAEGVSEAVVKARLKRARAQVQKRLSA